MSIDDLTTPLGQDKPLKARKFGFRLPMSAAQAIAALLGLFLLGFIAFALFNANPFGGEPMVRVAIDPSKLPASSASKPEVAIAPSTEPAKQPALPVPAANGQRTVTIIDGSSGMRRDVPIGGAADESAGGAAEPARMASADARLLENSRYGLIPVMAGGLTPFKAYAAGTDADRTRASKMPTIAIVVSGLGVGAAKTNDAIMKLPGAVTLAFTPYGSDPAKLVERARAQKHEVLLQIPMEPFDYPDNDPGPQTLLTTLNAEQNLDRLLWHLGRVQGYVGLANFMGAKFVATDASLQPVLREAAKRGLGYLDDGSSARSVAAAGASAQGLPFGKADIAIDTVPTSAEIDRALAKLESIAKDKGNAIGVASALPVSLDRLSTWSKSLEARGILLIPLTIAMQKTKNN